MVLVSEVFGWVMKVVVIVVYWVFFVSFDVIVEVCVLVVGCDELIVSMIIFSVWLNGEIFSLVRCLCSVDIS